MVPTDFQRNYLLEMLAREFPEVSGLEVDHFNLRMTPIPYHDGFGEKQEVPPTLRWRVGSMRHAFAPRPSFRRVTIKGIWPFISDRQGTEPYYGVAELDAIRAAIRKTITTPVPPQGSTSKEGA